MRVSTLTLMLVSALGLPAFPTGETYTLNLIEWDSNDLPRVYERSEQLPLSDEDLVKLSAAGFETAQLVKMLEERRCACDASADGMVRLKKQGVAPEVIMAMSTHALAPNRSLTLDLTLDFSGEGRVGREAFLHLFVDDGMLTRVFTANLGDVLARKNRHETTVDRSDLLLERQVRRVRLAGEIPLKTHGRHRLLVVSSARATLSHPAEMNEQERGSAKSFDFDYPRASLQSLCRLHVGYKRDAVLSHKWHHQGSRFECEWD